MLTTTKDPRQIVAAFQGEKPMLGTIKAIRWDKHRKTVLHLERALREAEKSLAKAANERAIFQRRTDQLQQKVTNLQNEVDALQQELGYRDNASA